MTKRIRLLIVSYYFPPAAGGGVQRVLGWARYLPQHGIDVEILAPDDPGWLQSGGVQIPDGVVVHRARNRSPRSLVPSAELAVHGGLRRLLRRLALQPRRMLYPDIHIGWSLDAVRVGKRVVRERAIDVVLSTSPPKTTHVIAWRLNRSTGVPWVADYRDSWLDLPHLRLDKLPVRARHAVDRRFAQRLMRRADMATTVSEPLATDLRRRHPQLDVHVVTNGVDLEALRDLPKPVELAAGRPRDAAFVVTYTGNFFGRQSPQTTLSAVEQVLERVPGIAADLVVRFVGQMKPADHHRIDSSPVLRAVIERVPFLPWSQVLAEQAAADLLLLYVAPGRGSAGVYTGKVFEYVASGRPVLALAPENNVASELVRDAAAGTVVDPCDVPAIADALEREWRRWRERGTATRALTDTVLERISRERQAARLAELVRGAARR